jgi:hypothetical protein
MVDLPHPDGPTMAKHRPGGRTRLTSSRTGWLGREGYVKETPLSSTRHGCRPGAGGASPARRPGPKGGDGSRPPAASAGGSRRRLCTDSLFMDGAGGSRSSSWNTLSPAPELLTSDE